MNSCQVAHCTYVAEASYEGFLLCALHDHPATRAILDRGERPGHYWVPGRPAVVPCGPLTEEDLRERPATGRAQDCPELLEAARGEAETRGSVHPNFDVLA